MMLLLLVLREAKCSRATTIRWSLWLNSPHTNTHIPRCSTPNRIPQMCWRLSRLSSTQTIPQPAHFTPRLLFRCPCYSNNHHSSASPMSAPATVYRLSLVLYIICTVQNWSRDTIHIVLTAAVVSHSPSAAAAICCSDSHTLPATLGPPLKRTQFHIIIPNRELGICWYNPIISSRRTSSRKRPILWRPI